MNISNDTLYDTDDLAKIIAKNTNKTLFIIYNQNKDSSYYVRYICFHNFTSIENLCKQIKKILSEFIYDCFEIYVNKNFIDIRTLGCIMEISNIPNLDLISEKDLLKYINNKY